MTYVKTVEPYRRSTMIFLVGNAYYEKLMESEEELQQAFVIYQNQMIVSKGSMEMPEEVLVNCVKKCKENQQNATGINPSDYLSLIRIEQAMKLLKESDMKVNEISQAVGYEDAHVLIRRFKKFVGKTPGQFRAE